ncbi:MAG: hypothetical protein ACREL4_08240 [Gemmatimonadales bacterium]
MSMRTWTLVLVGTSLLAACSADPTSPLAIGTVQLVSGDGQTGTPGVPLDDTLTVKVLDQTGRSPMSGVAVQWSVQDGGGTFDHALDTTDLQGMAHAVWTLGAMPGANNAVATVGDLPGVEFSASADGLRAVAVALGNGFACAIDVGHKGWCWGFGWFGELGNGATGPVVGQTYHPQAVTGGHTFVDIAVNFNAACGLDASGTDWCWGSNTFGQLGSPSPANTGTPMAVSGAPPFRGLAQGGNSNATCAIAADSTGYCWGDNRFGQTGAGTFGGMVTAPQAMSGGLKFRSITLGSVWGCGIVSDGTAWCWGSNSNGELGTGTPGNSAVPVPVAGAYHFTTLSAGNSYTCGLTNETGWVCWGLVSAIPPLQTTAWPTPIHASSLDGMTEFDPGFFLGAAVLGGRALMVFAVNSQRTAGAPIPIYAVHASDTNACGLTAGGQVYCWGYNDGGQLGSPFEYGWEPGYTPAQMVVAPNAETQLGTSPSRSPSH